MCSINILEGWSNCFPGDTVSGEVELMFSEASQFKAIQIKFEGLATSMWVDRYSSPDPNDVSKDAVHFGEDIYFNIAYDLVQGGPSSILTTGKHNFPFSFVLPENIPSSYDKWPLGNIYYFVTAVLVRTGQDDLKSISVINVIAPFDLNELPNLREPVALCVEETMTTCCCTNGGIITFNMSLPATGFVPGEEIHVGCYVLNMSTISVQSVLFTITEEVEFFVHKPSTKTKRKTYTVLECKEPGIGAHGEKSWTSTLIVPPGKYFNVSACKIINLDYRLKVLGLISARAPFYKHVWKMGINQLWNTVNDFTVPTDVTNIMKPATLILPNRHSELVNSVAIAMGTEPLDGITTTFRGEPPPGEPGASLLESLEELN